MSQEDIYDSYMLEANQAFTDAILGYVRRGAKPGEAWSGAAGLTRGQLG